MLAVPCNCLLLFICLLLSRSLGVSPYSHAWTEKIEDSGYRYSVPLDPDDTFWLFWDVNYVTFTVNFRLRAQLPNLSSWFGVGFSDHGEITGADLAVFWSSPDGWNHFQDGWSDEEGYLHIDRLQDYNLTSSSVSGDVIALEFSRRFDTCDDHDYVFDNGTTHLVYFRVEGQPRSVAGTSLKATAHGLTRVQLLKPQLPAVILPSDVWVYDVTAPDVRVPSDETTYWWYVTRLPTQFRSKHHVIKYEPLVQKGHEGLVHHMELFHCQTSGEDHVPLYSGPGQAEGRPPDLASCKQVIGAWAMGAQAMVYPQEAGVPLGGQGFSPYVMLEVHYNNPTRKTGLVDSSGLRFYVTSQLRAHDAGIMELGLEYVDKMAVPPQQDLFTLTGFCTAECTQVGLPPGGITVFASQLHSHLTGRRLLTRHVRGGVELPELNRDDHYSPHYQEIRRLQYPTKILPGDALITSCHDSTLDRDYVTLGGFSIHNEMCVNYVHYYPRVRLEVCKSSVATQSLNAFFTFMRVMEEQPTSMQLTPTENYQAIAWTPLNVHLLTSLYQQAPISLSCNRSDGARFPGHWEGVPKAEILVPRSEPPRDCPVSHR